jgi:23S rRNA (pseudouridine1915-N3)-methyltransferase
MKFTLLEPRPAQEEWAHLAQQVYQTKLKPFVPFEIKTVGSQKMGRAQAQEKKESESQALLREIHLSDYVVLFDENGLDLTSEKFAHKLQNILSSGKKNCFWIIGGAYGVSDEIKDRAQLKVKLAPFVMNHLVARTVALEQIYRAFCILKNLPYHNS